MFTDRSHTIEQKNQAEMHPDIKLGSKGVDVFYGSNKVLNDVTIQMKAHTITALIGPSGCGKSTYLRLFNRMNDFIDTFKMEGLIYIDGVDMYGKSVRTEDLRKNVGMVFQKPNPFPKTIFDNVAYGLRIQGVRSKAHLEQAVEKALRQADLWNEVKDDLKKNALALSGGQQQRLCIARALVVDPSVVLMDEPTSALDPISTAKIEDLLFELKASYTIVIVTHNMQQASRISDKTAFFYMGDLVEYDHTKTLFTNPKKDRTQKYITGRFG